MILVRKAASLGQRELLGNWLYGVAYRTALDARAAAFRRRKREKQVSCMPETEVRDEWWDAQTWKMKHACKQGKYVSTVVFSANGKMLASLMPDASSAPTG